MVTGVPVPGGGVGTKAALPEDTCIPNSRIKDASSASTGRNLIRRSDNVLVRVMCIRRSYRNVSAWHDPSDADEGARVNGNPDHRRGKDLDVGSTANRSPDVDTGDAVALVDDRKPRDASFEV